MILFLISQILWNKNNKDVLHNKLYPLRSVHCSPERFELIFTEAETEVQGSAMICLELPGQFAGELRLAVVFGPQAFPAAPCYLHAEDFSIPAAGSILVLESDGD